MPVSKKKTSVRAQCRICGKKLYSKSSNPDGKIICPDCDRKFPVTNK